MKDRIIKKRVFLESGIAVAVLAALGGVVYLLSSLSDQYTAEAGKIEGQVAAVNGELSALREKYNNVKNNKGLYDEVMQRSANDELSINRQSVRTKFDELKSKYFLGKPLVSMSAVQEVPAKSKSKLNALVSSDVKVVFDALNDEDIYGVVQSIQDHFSGVTRITKFSVVRNEKVTEAVLRAIANTGEYSLVKANIEFTWYGLKPLDNAINGAPGGPVVTGKKRR